MKFFIPAVAILAFLAPSSGFCEEMTEGQKLAITAFKSIDENGTGYVDMGEFNIFSENVFVSMDANDDGKVSVDEFLFWDIGMQPIAEQVGNKDALETAMRVVHSFWDRNGDGNLTRAEQRSSALYDFQRADLNGDATLTEAEFIGGFTIMKAIRAAIAPSSFK